MDKREKYETVISAFKGALQASIDPFVHLNNLAALLKKEFDFFWVGFYFRRSEDELVIGPYQGEVPCFHINLRKGVCGAAATTGLTQIVDDVHAFPGYIACHPEPNSEIVVPGMIDGYCEFVLDIDHIDIGYFDEVDQEMLESLCQMVITQKLVKNA